MFITGYYLWGMSNNRAWEPIWLRVHGNSVVNGANVVGITWFGGSLNLQYGGRVFDYSITKMRPTQIAYIKTQTVGSVGAIYMDTPEVTYLVSLGLKEVDRDDKTFLVHPQLTRLFLTGKL